MLPVAVVRHAASFGLYRRKRTTVAEPHLMTIGTRLRTDNGRGACHGNDWEHWIGARSHHQNAFDGIGRQSWFAKTARTTPKYVGCEEVVTSGPPIEGQQRLTRWTVPISLVQRDDQRTQAARSTTVSKT